MFLSINAKKPLAIIVFLVINPKKPLTKVAFFIINAQMPLAKPMFLIINAQMPIAKPMFFNNSAHRTTRTFTKQMFFQQFRPQNHQQVYKTNAFQQSVPRTIRKFTKQMFFSTTQRTEPPESLKSYGALATPPLFSNQSLCELVRDCAACRTRALRNKKRHPNCAVPC